MADDCFPFFLLCSVYFPFSDTTLDSNSGTFAGVTEEDVNRTRDGAVQCVHTPATEHCSFCQEEKKV